MTRYVEIPELKARVFVRCAKYPNNDPENAASPFRAA